ncbi:hypothetical protein GOBAR_AA29379 [Gossypium barbadense]|uniref:Uncharacterized protein n=1 Tax=Gossypium barbadense TaxID=3634 RepID=A0A2P5WJQ2_GOSBA|nr:hypothetical protein GOBAR_AA29379 [Gossypium barbadense]
MLSPANSSYTPWNDISIVYCKLKTPGLRRRSHTSLKKPVGTRARRGKTLRELTLIEKAQVNQQLALEGGQVIDSDNVAGMRKCSPPSEDVLYYMFFKVRSRGGTQDCSATEVYLRGKREGIGTLAGRKTCQELVITTTWRKCLVFYGNTPGPLPAAWQNELRSRSPYGGNQFFESHALSRLALCEMVTNALKYGSAIYRRVVINGNTIRRHLTGNRRLHKRPLKEGVFNRCLRGTPGIKEFEKTPKPFVSIIPKIPTPAVRGIGWGNFADERISGATNRPGHVTGALYHRTTCRKLPPEASVESRLSVDKCLISLNKACRSGNAGIVKSRRRFADSARRM